MLANISLRIRQAFLRISMPVDSELQNDSDLFAIVYVLIGDIERSFHSLNQQTSKQELLDALERQISHYPQLKNTYFQNAKSVIRCWSRFRQL